MEPYSDWIDLASAVSEFPVRRTDLRGHFTGRVFPHLNMGGWIEHILSRIDPGSVITFGGMARTLGNVKASRAVGEVIASGKVRGPIHRIVYSDGSVPPPSSEALSSEIDTVRKGDGMRIPVTVVPLEFNTTDPPLRSLGEMQDLTLPMVSWKPEGRVGSLAGIDISSGGDIHALAISRHDPDGNYVDSICLGGDPGLPYISGYLFYREGPVILPGIVKGEETGLLDDGTVLVMDGNGSLHPRRMGIATQVGVISDRASIGVAKKLMIGTVGNERPSVNEMRSAQIEHKGRTLGASLSNGGKKPIYVSPGHGIDLDTALDTIVRVTRTRIPEPIKWAHRLSNEFRKKQI